MRRALLAIAATLLCALPSRVQAQSGNDLIHKLGEFTPVPNPTFPAPQSGPGRLAPGAAQPFWRQRALIGRVKPSIVVGGDQASRVWVLDALRGSDVVRGILGDAATDAVLGVRGYEQQNYGDLSDTELAEKFRLAWSV